MQRSAARPGTALFIAVLVLGPGAPIHVAALNAKRAERISREPEMGMPVDGMIGGTPSPLYWSPKEGAEEFDGDMLVRASKEYEWRSMGHATEARASSHHVKAQAAAKSAKEAAAGAAKQVDADLPEVQPVLDNEKATEESLKIALENEEKMKLLIEETRKKAFDEAKKSAEEKVKQLEAEALAYWKELLAKLAALANPPPDPAAEAAAKAAEPYFKLALRTGAIVAHYNQVASEMVAQAKGMVKLAFQVANQAKIEQANGDAEMALRHMIQGHMLVTQANLKEGGAKKIYKLAMSLNSSIPAYQMAAQQAAIHVLATFSGIQMDAITKRRNPFKGKKANGATPSEADQVIHTAEKSQAEADKQLKHLGSELESLSASIASVSQELGQVHKK